MKKISGGITKPLGFKANGMACGLKRSGKPDLALMTSDVPAVAAAVFTKNSIKAAPLIVSQKHIRDNKIQAVITNSGYANCFTGKFGLLYAQQTAEITGNSLNIPIQDVFVLSTGIIGKPLPFKLIENALPELVKGLSKSGSDKAAHAILTTDLKIKQTAVEIKISGKKVTIAGCAKGSGMIAPNMATMLGYVTTDAAISATLLKKALKEANEQSFNAITVDGCMSTNDTVVIMANGMAGNKKITSQSKDYAIFLKALNFVCLDLAKMIVLDGEGATKFIKVNISGAKTKAQARTIGMSIANSMLVKTAAYGKSPNWGRVAAAVGSLGITGLTEENLKISFSSFEKKEIDINVDMNLGKENNTVYTCDLSNEYININANYN